MTNYVIGIICIVLLMGMAVAASNGLSILKGATGIIVGQQASSGTPPYTYQWFSECPSCAVYNSILGATNTVYYFNSNGVALGVWSFIEEGIDSTNAMANSISVSLNVTTYVSSINGLGNAIILNSAGNSITVNTIAPNTISLSSTNVGGSNVINVILLGNISQEGVDMIEYLLAGFAILLLSIRIVKHKESTVIWIVSELVAGIVMALALAFFVLLPNSAVTTTGSIGNTVVNVISTSNNALILNSWMPSLLYAFIAVFELIVIVLMLWDVSGLFFSKKKGVPPMAQM